MLRSSKRYHNRGGPVKEMGARLIGTNPALTGPSEAEIEPVLVLSGVTTVEDLRQFPYSPFYVLEGIGDIPEGA